MFPFVKLYTRRFHVTSRIFLRKVAPKISSADQKHEFSEIDFDVASECQTSCPDYLGIESDENVIVVKPQKHILQQPLKSDTREKFYRASFGIVRLDAENKLKYHGQYKGRTDFSFPHCSSEDVQVNDISKTPLYKNEKVQSLFSQPKNSGTVPAIDILNTETNNTSLFQEKDVDINYIDECYFSMSEKSDLAQDKIKETAPEESNITEKDYNETLNHSRNFSVEKDTLKYFNSEQGYDPAFCKKNQAEELNYFENEYFGALNNSENVSLEQDSKEYSHSKKISSYSNSQDQLKELNYLEKDYFGDCSNSECQDISNNIDNDSKINSVFGTKDQNFFSKNDNLATDELNILSKSLYKNSSLSNVQNSIHHEDAQMSSLNFLENNNVIKNKDIHNLKEINYDDETEKQNKITDSEFNDANIKVFKNVIQKQADEVNFKKFSLKAQMSDTMSRKNTEPSLESADASKKLHNETAKSFSMENKFKFSKLVPEEPNQDNDVSTAHDFVIKLREKQQGKNTKEQKFDSKGFRILSNQVPDLTYFTHDEILDILKQNIVYSDDDLLVLNKPYSLVIHESKTTKEPCLSNFLEDLAKELDKQSSNPKLFTVHRLDKETTGCLLLARNETMAAHLKSLFAQRKIVKKYWIITAGVPDPPEGVIDMPISEGSINNRKRMVLHPKLTSDVLYKSHSKHGKPAVSTYKVLSESGNAALVEVFPKTGVKHQIRVHFGFGLGCPVLGDHKYSHLDKLVPQTLPSDMLQKLRVRQSKVRHIPMHIHAKSVGIAEYFDKRDLFVNIPIPDHFKLNLKSLKFRKKDMIY